MNTEDDIEKVVDARSWVGHPLHDVEDRKIGTIETVYFDDESGMPVWAALGGGFVQASQTFVPLDGVRVSAGGSLLVPYVRSIAKAAPEVVAQGGHLTPQEIDTLRQHYHDQASPYPDGTSGPRTLEQPFRGSSNESTFGSGQVGPGEPDDVTAMGTGHSDSEVGKQRQRH